MNGVVVEQGHWRRSRVAGIAAAAAGATAGMIVSFVAAVPMANRATDNENGWFHDADWALVFVAGLIILVGIAAGSALGVAALRQRRVLATALTTVPAVIAVTTAMVLFSVPSVMSLAIPAVAASASRALVERRPS